MTAATDLNIVKKQGILPKIQAWIVNSMERFFYWYGKSISRRPWLYILICSALTGISALGLFRFHRESNGVKLWIPEHSEFRQNIEWMWANYPPSIRFSTMLFISENGGNVLDADVIRSMYRVRKDISNIKTEFGESWEDVCQRAPIMREPDVSTLQHLAFSKKRRRRSANFDFEDDEENDLFDSFDNSGWEEFENENFNISSLDGDFEDIGEYYNVNYYPQPYCKVVNQMDFACLEMSILELWANDGKYDEATDKAMESLTNQDVLDKLNSFNKSGVFLRERNFTEFLSEIKRDESGLITGASAAIINWISTMNMREALNNSVVYGPEPITAKTYAFEGQMLDIMFNTTDYPESLISFPHIGRSFTDVGVGAILGDSQILFLSYMIVINYVYIMLGRFNCVEQRVYAGMSGILAVIMGIIVCFGLGSALGLFFGPVHSVMPFLLLGIGIDNMFVIVQCYENIKSRKGLDFSQKFGVAMQHAGVAITITSLTDVVAFAIGGTTILPALRFFCLYASIGIAAIYVFQCTFFLACLCLDQRRIDAKRNGFLPCIKHKKWKPVECSQRDICKTIFKQLGKALTKPPVKVFVFIFTAALAGLGIYGNYSIKHEFDPTKFLPSDSYLYKWFDYSRIYFPDRGDIVTIHIAEMDIYENFDTLVRVSEELKGQTDILYGVEAWPLDFQNYLNRNYRKKDQKPIEKADFESKMVQFLYSPRGAKYQNQLNYENETKLTCGAAKPKVAMSFIKFFHDRFATPVEAVPAMKKVKDIVKKAEANITNGKIFPIARSYSLWETDDVIGTELYRNMGLALVCVFLTTLVLLANLSAALMVLLCVLLALLDIGGFMYFWGLTIDTVSCNNLIIAIGLCIDYASHIAHRFLIEPGPDRNSRIRSTLENIGPAVLNGGLTTLFAFILLANSQSHVFLTFFKVFFLVVSFGLYHGLVVLPVFLSLFGPESHVIIQADTNAEAEMNVAGASGHESKNLVKTNDDTEMKEYSDNNKTTDQNDAVKNNVH